VATVPVARAQQAFTRVEDAANALSGAARSGITKNLLAVLGANAADLASSGDDVADAATRQSFLKAYDEKHQVKMEGDDKAVLVIGQNEYPFPIPLVRKDGAWRFDIAAGREQILYRRIGRNELDAIQVSLAYVDAQGEYAAKARTGTVASYAQRMVSHPGKKDGLYWQAAQGEDASPIGDLVAGATAEGYRVGEGPAPFHGYYYKILTKQGPTAPGGAIDYVVRGDMIGGFALVAYPAEYGNSGVMTFMVNHNGIVWQKDLGPRTEKIAGRMTSFNPDHTWQKITVEPPAK
jgi:hypothetical protein